MTSTKARLGLFAAAFVIVAGGTAASAGYGLRNSMRLAQPVALPGVVLYSGSYSIEVMDPWEKMNIVRVSSLDSHRLRYTGFALRVPRPADLSPNAIFTFGEARPGEPAPITAWFPLGENYGHEFIR